MRPTNPYTIYISSREYSKRKRERVKAVNSCCERCGEFHPAKYLVLHHRTYERMGAEHDEDLELLCRACHVVADQEREAQKA